MKKKMGVLLSAMMMGVMLLANASTAQAANPGYEISVVPKFDANDIHVGETYSFDVTVKNNTGADVTNIPVGVNLANMNTMCYAQGGIQRIDMVNEETKTVTISLTVEKFSGDSQGEGEFGKSGDSVFYFAYVDQIPSNNEGGESGQYPTTTDRMPGTISQGANNNNNNNTGDTTGDTSEPTTPITTADTTTVKKSPKTGQPVNVLMMAGVLMIFAGTSYVVIEKKKNR